MSSLRSFASSASTIIVNKYHVLRTYKVNTFSLLLNLFLSWTYFKYVWINILNDVLLGLSVTEIKKAVDTSTLVTHSILAVGTLPSFLWTLSTSSTSYHKLLLSNLIRVKRVLLVSCNCLQLILSKGCITYSLVNIFVRNWVYLSSGAVMTIALSRHLIWR